MSTVIVRLPKALQPQTIAQMKQMIDASFAGLQLATVSEQEKLEMFKQSITEIVGLPVDLKEPDWEDAPIVFKEQKPKGFKKGRFTDEFEKFWDAVENKVGKHQAQRNFAIVYKDGMLDQMVSAVKRHQEWHKKRNGSLKFMPHPATWLIKRRWEDELEEADRDRGLNLLSGG